MIDGLGVKLAGNDLLGHPVQKQLQVKIKYHGNNGDFDNKSRLKISIYSRLYPLNCLEKYHKTKISPFTIWPPS